MLERGREWKVKDFPRQPDDPWVFDPDAPEKRHGWFDLRMFPNMSVIQGAGVGGGSLVYANISVEAKRDTFAAGWPAEITYDVLAPHYAEVGRMMEVQRVPAGQWPERTKLLHDAANAAGWQNRFRSLELAVRFDPNWRTASRTRTITRSRSRDRTCTASTRARACISASAISAARSMRATPSTSITSRSRSSHGARILPLHLVRTIAPVAAGGYEVSADEIVNGTLEARTFTAEFVVVAAGSLGSTELLLRSRAAGGAAEPQPAPRRRLEQQRRFPDAGDPSVPRRRTRPRSDDHRAPSICSTANT